MSGAALIGGYAADLALGDPRRFHPVAGFGRAALAVERATYAPSKLRGLLFAGALVAAAAAVAESATRAGARFARGRPATFAVVVWAALGGRSLAREAARIGAHLDAGDLPAARQALPSLCGRDATALDQHELARAVVESVAENTSDAVVAPLFWGAIAGPAGVAAYRAANTLDAMVGNRSPRYASFGWAAAKLDDALNWPAARIGALLTVASAPLVGGSARNALATLNSDGSHHPSPNAGRMEAAFAGALAIRLGGPLAYDGRAERRPTLNAGARPASATDIARATRLSLAVGAASALLAAIATTLRPHRGARP